jgi:hypothetical protein
MSQPPGILTLDEVSPAIAAAVDSFKDAIKQDKELKKNTKIKIISINVRINPDCVLVERNGRYYWLCSD